jgi:hypothetical protein
MSEVSPRSPHSPFDAIRHTDTDPERGEFEWWSAREAMEPLGYLTWEGMENVIRKAKAACRNSGHGVAENFRDVTKVSGQRGPRQADTQMTRFGMYLLAMNGDPDKPEIAAAQRYFAVQTYRAEQLLPPPQAPPAVQPPRPWADRFRLTFMPHFRDLHQRHPGCFSVVSAAVSQIVFIEDELVRHLMTTRGFDRPDISIGRRYSDHRRGERLAEPTRSASLYLPDQNITVEVRVYEGSEWSFFTTWFHDTYLTEHLGYYLDRKRELKPYSQLTRFSAADNACQSLSGQPAVLPPRVRAALTAAGGFAPARQLPPPPRRQPPAIDS